MSPAAKLVGRAYREEWDAAESRDRHMCNLSRVVARRTGLSVQRVQVLLIAYGHRWGLRP